MGDEELTPEMLRKVRRRRLPCGVGCLGQERGREGAATILATRTRSVRLPKQLVKSG